MQNNFNISIFVHQYQYNMVIERILKNIISLFLIVLFSNICFGQNESTIASEESILKVVVIDAGHGGKDYGASVHGAKEKDIVLDICLKLGGYIKKNFPQVKVIYTRNSDMFIPLYKRAQIANKNKADLFISIHANYVGATSVTGTETFVLGNHRSEDNLEIAKKENSVILLEDNYNATYEGFDPNSSESYIMFEMVQNEYLSQSLSFASEVQNQFKERAKRIDRGVKQAGFLVLRETTMPSVLIEVGFISNPYEKNYLVSEDGKTYLASAIYRSFKEYKERIESKSKFHINVPNEISEIDAEDNALNVQLTDNETILGDTYFSIQIAAGSKAIETIPANFKGLKNIYMLKVGNIYKYYCGKYATYGLVQSEKNKIQQKYPDSFIVAFDNNKTISIKKALKKTQ